MVKKIGPSIVCFFMRYLGELFSMLSMNTPCKYCIKDILTTSLELFRILRRNYNALLIL